MSIYFYVWFCTHGTMEFGSFAVLFVWRFASVTVLTQCLSIVVFVGADILKLFQSRPLVVNCAVHTVKMNISHECYFKLDERIIVVATHI